MNAFRIFSILAGAAVLAACGGSSSGSFDEGGAPEMSMSAETTEVPAKGQHFQPNPEKDYTVQVNVRFLRANGSPVENGTEVSLATSSSARGVVAPADDPQAIASQATSTTSGGTARFWFVAGSTQGPVTLTASGTAPSGGTATAELDLTVIEPSDGAARLSIEGDRTMPANKQDVGIFRGSPFINELRLRYLGPDGEPGMVRPDEDDRHTAQVSISPVSRAAFSTLVDPETDVDDFTFLLGTGGVLVQAGMGTIFVHSFDEPGQVTITATAQDIDESDDNIYSAEFTLEIIDDASDLLPAQIDFGVSPDPVYIEGSGGTTTKQLSVEVRDSGGNPVPDPEGHGASFNNVHLELVAPEGSGARLTGTGANGSVSGQEIRVRTISGIANFALTGATETGTHRIIATVDRADNNVDNELTDPLTAETAVTIGDGRLASLVLVSPFVEAIRQNLTADIDTDLQRSFDPETGELLVPDGTYSLTVTAMGTDKAGNPVLPGTPVNFGKIDAPLSQTLPRMFVFSGGDGNPEEGGTLFSVLESEEGFLDDPNAVDEAVEAGDTLAMFGKLVPGNREHEAVRTVDSVIDDTTINVTEPFNPNDASGSIVDDGHVIPWAIGRSEIGTIDNAGNLDEQGRVSVQLTYPTNQIGRPVVLWGQGSRVEGSGTKTVADVENAVLPGVAPLLLTANPSAIQGNTTSAIRLCLTDALGAPVNNVRIRGTISGGNASGELDGEPMATLTARVTGSDGSGCLVTEARTRNMLPEGEGALITFSVSDAQAEVEVVPPGSARLLVNPSLITDVFLGGNTRLIELTLLDIDDEPISGSQLVGECEADGGTLELAESPGVTDGNGETTATVFYDMAGCGTGQDDPDFPRTGRCEFTTTTGTPVGTLLVIGRDLNSFAGFSPAPGCPDPDDDDEETDEWTLSVSVDDNRDPAGDSTVVSTPSGITCDADGGSCTFDFDADTETVILQAPSGSAPDWIGDCEVNATNPDFAEVSGGTNQSCVVVFE